MITIVRVTNPIDPSRGRIVHEQQWNAVSGCRLDDFLSAESLADLADGRSNAETFREWAEAHHVSVNGQTWPASMWPEVTPRDGDCIVIAPVVQGGGVLKSLTQLALVVGVAALSATGVGATLGAAIFSALPLGAELSLSTAASFAIGTAVLGAAATVGGNLLISAIFSGSKPSSKGVSASYDPDGPKSLARSGSPIPKGYGSFRWGGNCIASFTEIAGNDQFINALFCYGFGPARSMEDYEINGKPVSSYQNVQIFTRLGTNDQTELANFNRIVNGYGQSTQCKAGVPIVVPGTGTETQMLQVDVAFPSGVFYNTNNGNVIEAVVTYLVEHREAGNTGPWLLNPFPRTTTPVVAQDAQGNAYLPYRWGVIATDIGPESGVVHFMDDGPHTPGDKWSGTRTLTAYQPNGNHNDIQYEFFGEWQLLDIRQNYVAVVDWTGGYQDFVGASTSALYNRTTVYLPHAAKWDVRITYYGVAKIHDDVQPGDNHSPNIGGDMWLHSVNEITLQDLVYPNMILIGVRALATSQLSGSGLNVTALIEHGLHSRDEGMAPPALASFEEDNPACVVADMFTDDMYGGGLAPGIVAGNIERYADEWVGWAENSDTLVPDGNGGSIRLCVFNGVFDEGGSNLWDAANTVGQMSRATLVQVGKDYGVAVDKQEDTAVQQYTMGNMLADSFSEHYLTVDERATQVEIEFADSTRYYKTDNPLVYMDPDNQNSGKKIKPVRIDGKGITIPAQAWHHARYKERSNQFLLSSGKFRTDTDGIAARQSNVIAIAHDVPGWGLSGRTLPGSTASRVVLDRDDAAMETGTSYSLQVQHPDLQRFSGTVSAVAASIAPSGTKLTIAGWPNSARVTRAIVNGMDCAVASSDVGSVIVQTPGSFVPAVGQSCALFDTDVLEIRSVTSIDSKGRLVLGSPLSKAPEDYSGYIFGETGTTKWARVTKMTRASENRSSIEYLDYDDRVYDVATPVIGETSAQSTSSPGVTSLTGSETFAKVGGSYVSYANLAWVNGRDTVGVGIYAKSANAPGIAKLVARLPGSPTSWQSQQTVGTQMIYAVVGYDAKYDYAAFTTAPAVTIDAVGVATNLLLGSNFASGFTYWNIRPRTGDTFVPTFDNDGQATYAVGSTALHGPQRFCYQVIDPAKWSVGDVLMLSGYWQDTAVSPSAPNSGDCVLEIQCTDASNAVLSSTVALGPLNTATLTRAHTAAVAIPANTTTVAVLVSIGPADPLPSMPAGSTLTISHLLLEIAAAGQTTPSAWADIDVSGQILDLFTSGSSAGLRAQGSVLPTFNVQLGYTSTDSSVTITWTGLAILWPDGLYTYVPDGSLTIDGLSAATSYYAYPSFDIQYGAVILAVGTTPVGTPALLSAAADTFALAAAGRDGRVSLTPNGFSVATVATGGSDGGGSSSDPNPLQPIEAPVGN